MLPAPPKDLSSPAAVDTRYPDHHDQQHDTYSVAQDLPTQPSQPEEEVMRRHISQEKHGIPRHDEQPPVAAAKPDPFRREVRFDQAPQVINARKERELGPQDEVLSDDEAGAGCFGGLFKKKRVDPIKNRDISEKRNAPKISPSAKPKPGELATIKPGGGGVVPGIDAPVSAVNTGERRVLVEYNGSSMLLPIALGTTPMDLITSAANVFSDPIDLRATALLECFNSVGVQRPLRRYEHVRNVMNSWDDDKANSLLLVPTRAIGVDPAGLSASNVSKEAPSECSFQMQYSQKPGHWEKRTIILREDGQIVMTKGSSVNDATNVCHLSDFDIYSPTATQLSKKIKPPKKFCYAIKSQQKTTMFLSASTYVHFFCAGERAIATSFYDAVQGWRSWYLVNVMGEGEKKQRKDGDLKHSSNTKGAGHQRNETNASITSHYMLGSFKPMALDFERPGSSHSQSQQQPTLNQLPSRKLSTRDRTRPPVSLSKHKIQAQLTDQEPLVSLASNRRGSFEASKANDEAFESSGLLGRSYSTRRREAEAREDTAKNPFKAGGLLNNDTFASEDAGLAQQTSVKRTSSRHYANKNSSGVAHHPSTRDSGNGGNNHPRRAGSIDLGRSNSTRARGVEKAQPKPLIDLTPQYVPPPQHIKKGKAYKPRPEEIDMGLVDAATSGERTWRDDLPEVKDWRGRATGAGSGAGTNQGTQRSRSRSVTAGAQIPHGGRYTSPVGSDDQQQASTGSGYLAHSKSISSRHVSGGNSHPHGHGYGSGNTGQAPINGPLIDVSDAANFTKGSLLARVEREHPSSGPIIDRDS